MARRCILLTAFFCASIVIAQRIPLPISYEISDDLGLGRRFDGIGAISGGGATSKLLVNYPEPQRSQILDYLFKPNFGASLQILKVEIGGDDASVGSESSHMHEEWDENYNRGYEWWLMKEAKKRNPSIELAGLSWSWPGWLGVGLKHPYKNLAKTAMYTIKWIQGAKTHHDLDIDYIGIWNEQWCNPDYIVVLRQSLNTANLTSVKIIGCDNWFDSFINLMKNKTVADAVYAFGVHYPGTITPQTVLDTNLTIWSSEDYSTFNDDIGAGCWARTLNQNYVVGYMTSTIAWNLIASYYPGQVFDYQGLMTAVEPWSGHYEVKNPIWTTAHTTQFTEIGYRYLQHRRGVGLLKYGGSFVTLTSSNRKNLTLIIETLSHDHSICIRPPLPPYEVQQQKAIFKFGGSFTTITELHMWRTSLNFTDPKKSVIFYYAGKVEVINNRLALDLEVDSVYTLTTFNGGHKGDHGLAPESRQFPIPYFDNFDGYQVDEEPYVLSPQVGSWEIMKDPDGNGFARQVVQNPTVTWCSYWPGGNNNRYPTAMIGDAKWQNITITSKIRTPRINGTSQIYLATRFGPTECYTSLASGVFLWLTAGINSYVVTTDLVGLNIADAGLLSNGPILYDKWYNVSLSVKGANVTASIDGNVITDFELTNASIIAKQGFAALGAGYWGHADFDDLRISD